MSKQRKILWALPLAAFLLTAGYSGSALQEPWSIESTDSRMDLADSFTAWAAEENEPVEEQSVDAGAAASQNTDLTYARRLENAGLNTLLGMGMAFAVLILISLVISLFSLFSGTGRRKKKKKVRQTSQEITERAMDQAIEQISEKEDLLSDTELVAVITAAICAYEEEAGNQEAGTGTFRVRSIRRVNPLGWKRA